MTDDLNARKRLIHADRLASLGVLAAGVAHEINNPAAFILLGTQQLERMIQQLPEDLPARPRSTAVALHRGRTRADVGTFRHARE